MIKKTLVALAVSGALVGCTTTPQGKSIDRANYVDLASTAAALASGASEANPLGLALIPIKTFMGYGVEKMYPNDCLARTQIAASANSIYYGAAVNNLAIVAGATGALAPVVGLAAGVTYYMMRDTIEPSVFECLPKDGPMRSFAIAYAQGDVEGIVDSFALGGADGDTVGLEAIRASYEVFFANTSNRSMVFANDTQVQTEVDGMYTLYDYEAIVVDEKITSLTYTETAEVKKTEEEK